MKTTVTRFSKRATTVSSSTKLKCRASRYVVVKSKLQLDCRLHPFCVPQGLSMQTKLVSNQQMDDIAAKLGSQWKTLAGQLEIKAAEIREIETDSKDVDMQAKLLLVAWQDREGTQATVESLVPALNAAGFPKIAEILNET